MKDSTAVGAVFNRDILAWVAVKNRSHRSFRATWLPAKNVGDSFRLEEFCFVGFDGFDAPRRLHPQILFGTRRGVVLAFRGEGQPFPVVEGY